MDLVLLQRFVDDGIAKHKAFAELAEVVSDAHSIAQYTQELKASQVALRSDVEKASSELEVLNRSINSAKANYNTTLAEMKTAFGLENSKLEAERKEQLEANRSAATKANDVIVGLQRDIDSLEAQKLTAAASLESIAAAKIDELKAVTRAWEIKLADAQIAYSRFVGQFPK